MYSFNINQKAETEFDLGNLHYDADRQVISSSNEEVYLRNKLNEVLYLMVSNQTRLVSRNELIEKVWNGNYYTGPKGVTHSVCKLRKTLEDLGAGEVQIKTLPKRGYTLSIN